MTQQYSSKSANITRYCINLHVFKVPKVKVFIMQSEHRKNSVLNITK